MLFNSRTNHLMLKYNTKNKVIKTIPNTVIPASSQPFKCKKVKQNQISAAAPSTLVITFCPNEPTAIAKTPWMRLRGGRNITRPPYSPMRFGVNMAQVRPQKTPSIHSHRLILTSFFVKCCHFRHSTSQLASINATTTDIIMVTC